MLALVIRTVAFVCSLFLGSANAQPYPSKPIKVVVPYAAGAASDVLCRVFLDQLRKVLDQSLVIDNRPGAGGNIGSGVVAKTGDPYTLLCTGFAVHVTNPFLYSSMGFDPDKELLPIVAIAESPYLLLVNNKFRDKTAVELLGVARASPNAQSVGTGSSSSRIILAMVAEAANVKMLNVPYAGTNRNVITDLIRGELDFVVEPAPGAQSALANGQLTAIANTASKRSSFLPNVPTFLESGVNVATAGWLALYAPIGTPPEAITILNKAGNDALKDPAVLQRLATLSAEPLGGSPADLTSLIRKDRETWGRAIKQLGLKAQ